MNCDRARRLAHDMACASIQELASDADPRAMAELEAHLWSCAECRGEVRDVRDLCARMRDLGSRRAPDDFTARTMNAVRAEWRRRRRPKRRSAQVQLRRALAAAAAAAVIAGAGVYVAGHRPHPSSPGSPMKPNVAPLVAEYSDFRARQPFGDLDGMALVRARAEQQERERQK